MAAATAAHRHNTWPPSKARYHPSDDRRFWVSLPLTCIDGMRRLERNLSHIVDGWASPSSHTLPHMSIRWGPAHDIFGHRRFPRGRRSQSLEPEPTCGDAEPNHITFNRMNSASPDSNSQASSTNENSLLLEIGAGLFLQDPILRRPGHDGTMTPNSQSIVLGPHYTGPRTLLTFAVGCPSPRWHSSPATTENLASSRPSVSGTQTRNESNLRHSVVNTADQTISGPMTEEEQEAAQRHELYNINEEVGEPSSSRKRKRSQSSDVDDQNTAARQDSLCPCCKRPRNEHE